MSAMVGVARISLLDQDAVRRSVPDAGPRGVRPADAEWKIRLSRADHLPKGTLEKLPAGKPVVVVAKRLDPILARHIRLRLPRLRKAQVIKPKVRRYVRLIMAAEQRLRLRGVGPFGKSPAPPFVVFWNRMELRQVERDQACKRIHRARIGFAGH